MTRCTHCQTLIPRATLHAHLASAECAEGAARINAARKLTIDRAAELAAIEAAAIRRVPPGVGAVSVGEALRGKFMRLVWTCPVCREEMFAGQRKAHEADGCEVPALAREAAVMAGRAVEWRNG